MNTPELQFAEQTRMLASHLLSDQFGIPIHLADTQNISASNRARVYRCAVLEGPADVPKSVIVKRAYIAPPELYDPNSYDVPTWTFLNELASLQFLRESIPDLTFTPRLFCSDPTSGIMIMEDLGSGKRLDHLLLDNDPLTAEQALLDHARIHGFLHAQTIGKQDAYLHIRRQLGPIQGPAANYYGHDWLATALYDISKLLDVSLAPGVDVELSALKKAMEHPGPFLTFVQSDACPDNCLYVAGRLHLLDFEGGRFDHALKEGVYGRVPFPTCWCVYRLPSQLTLQMEATYRSELVKGCHEAADDTLFYRAVTEACAFWMLDVFHKFPMKKLIEQDYKGPASTARERIIMRADLLVQTIEQFGHLEAIGVSLKSILNTLRHLWPEATNIPLYPAFSA